MDLKEKNNSSRVALMPPPPSKKGTWNFIVSRSAEISEMWNACTINSLYVHEGDVTFESSILW